MPAQAVNAGRLFGIGVGPGDPELMTLKAVRCLAEAAVLAYVASGGRASLARQIAAPHVPPGKREINIALPMHPRLELAQAAYDEGASRIAAELEQGWDVAVLCEGDPLFYGSFIQLLARLGGQYRSEIVPGVISITAAAAAARMPLAWRTRTFSVLPATLPPDQLRQLLRQADGAAILKVRRHLAEIRAMLEELGLLERAVYVERASTPDARVMPLVELEGELEAPYFALILVPPAP